jgi:hypothetical protein
MANLTNGYNKYQRAKKANQKIIHQLTLLEESELLEELNQL